MCTLFAPRCCRGGLFISTLALSLLGTVASMSAASPGAAFIEFPAPASSAFSQGFTAMTSTVISGITAIPEPASCFLFGTGVFALLAMRRRGLRRRG